MLSQDWRNPWHIYSLYLPPFAEQEAYSVLPHRQQEHSAGLSLSLCLPAFSSVCLFCAVLGWCCTAAVFSVRLLAFVSCCSFSHILPVCCLLACTFPALAMGSLCSAPGPCSRAPCSSLPLFPCADSRTLMLNWPCKKMHYLTPSFPKLGF